MKNRVSQTPCYVRVSGMTDKDIPGLRGLFAEAGMNVTPDKDAKCSIMVSGYVSMSKPDGGRVVPVNADSQSPTEMLLARCRQPLPARTIPPRASQTMQSTWCPRLRPATSTMP